MPRIYMRDFLTLDLRTATREFIYTDNETATNSLLVHVAATHAGIVNGNNRFYRPDKMMQGTSSWTEDVDYPRPVLAHHNEDGDPLGRVLTARYMDLSYLYRDEFPILNDSVFYCSDAKKRMSTIETVDWVVDNLSDLNGYKGLGYIDLGLKITEPKAIQQVGRKEFLTVSVGFSTDSAICSICHQDWAVDDRCDHQLGQKYKGKSCYVISGAMDFNEVSFVNSPADPFATTLSVEKLTDSKSRSFFLGLPRQVQDQRAKAAGVVLSDALFSSDIEMLGDGKEMLDLKALAEEFRAGINEDRALAIRQSLTDFKAENDDDKRDAKKLLSSVRAKIKTNGWGTAKPAGDAGADAALTDEASKLQAELEAADRRGIKEKDATTEGAGTIAAAETPVLGVADAAVAGHGQNVLQLSDAVTKIFEHAQCKDANEDVKKVVSDLEAKYLGLGDSEKRYLRWGLQSLAASWYDREDFESYMGYLTADKDMVVLPKAELDEKDSAIEAYETSEQKLTDQIQVEKDAKTRVVKQTKDALATMVVMNKVMSGATGFTGLDAKAIQDQIGKLAARDLNSLLDSRDDILESLPAFKAAAHAAGHELGKSISDKARLESPTATTKHTDSTEENETPKREPQIPMSRSEQLASEARQRYLRRTAE